MRRKIFGYISIFLILIILMALPPLLINNIGVKEFQYLFKPLIYISIAIISFILIKKNYEVSNFNKKSLRQMALIGTLLYIIMYYLLGLLIGYSKSPFKHSLSGIMINMVIFMIIAISEEVIRTSYIKSSQENRNYTNVVLITILLTITSIDQSSFLGSFNTVPAMLTFLLKFFFPSLITNLFLSYLVYREGIFSSLLYKLPFLFVYLLTPVFPANNYAILCVVELIVPLFIYFKIEKDYFTQIKYSLKERFSGFEKVRFLIFVFIIVAIVSFNSGVYPLKPVVIVTGSMEPVIKRGDVVVYEKINYEEIVIGDIIVYNLDKVKVIHRVIDIQKTNKYGRVLITKGDNNVTKDSESVLRKQVVGKVVSVIAKVGYPAIAFNEFFNGKNDNVGVETGS